VGIESSTTATTTSFIKTTVIAETFNGTLSTEGNESISKGKVYMKHVFRVPLRL